jgi:hypothetical protein
MRDMEHISKEYLLLFNTITDTAQALQALQMQLLTAQLRAERLFVDETGNTSDDAVAFTQDNSARGMVS